ncbi:MAG: hypothetical protein IKP91_04230 [Bacteroidaceae bacterium]|nr:hypothetical protein [Bacteroidaceae bacterium]
MAWTRKIVFILAFLPGVLYLRSRNLRYMKSLRRCFPILVLLLLAAGLSSCRDAGVHDALLRAEALMETDPHAARDVLDSLNLQSSIFNLPSKDVADWAWLKVQTDYKCDVPLTTDSLARIATDYYGTPRRPDYHAAMAWYTLGCVYKDMGDDVNGTDAFLKAKSLFPDTLIRYYALTETNLGLHYMNRSMKKEAIKEFLCAKQNLVRLSDSTSVAFLDLKIAECHLYSEDYCTAKTYLDNILANSFASNQIIEDTYFELAKVEAYQYHRYEKAQEYLDYKIFHTSNKKRLPGSYSMKGDIFQAQGQFDSAWHFYNRSLSCRPEIATFAYVYLQKASLASRVGKTDSIQAYIQLHDHYIDSLYAISNQQAIRQVMNDHRVEMEQQRLEESHRRLIWTMSLIGLAFIIAVLGVFVWSLNLANRKKQQYIQISDQLKKAQMQEERQKTELAKAREEADRLKTAYQEALQHINELETISPTDYESRIRICVNQFRKGLSWQLVQKYLHGSEHSLRKEERVAIRHDLNVCFTDFYEILQTEGKKVNQTEKMVSACYILGFKTEETEEILGFSDSTVRVQKHRLKEKLPQDLYQIIFSSTF